jgi:MerR family transcriptional regulator, copper efflux regulator
MFTMLRVNADMRSTPEREQEVSIGAAAHRFGLSPPVLRHWEAEKVLTPARVRGRRVYRSADLVRIAVILRAKEAGLSLADIRAVVNAGDSAVRQATLRRREADLVEVITQAQASLDLIRCALACDHEDIATCPHFQQLITTRLHSAEGQHRSA